MKNALGSTQDFLMSHAKSNLQLVLRLQGSLVLLRLALVGPVDGMASCAALATELSLTALHLQASNQLG
jgi:hypothetical protein